MTDIIIIGGGIAGISAAATLAPNASVTLLEAEPQLGYHASGRSAAMFLEDYGNETVRALNHASHDHHKTANGGVLSQRGLMLVARPSEQAEFTTEARGFNVQQLSITEARNLFPILHPENTGFIGYRDDAFDLDADRLLQNYTGEARRGGATIVANAKVTAITKSGSKWEVLTATAPYRADIIINAAGAWVDEVATMAGIPPLGFQPMRRSMARLPAPGGLDVSRWPFVDSVGERWYAKPDAGCWLVSPSEAHPVQPHDAWADDMVLAEGLDRYSEMVTEPVTRLQSSWAGLRTFAPDRALVIGRDTTDSGFFWLAGQGGYGFQTAPAASALIADLVLSRAPELPSKIVTAVNPNRFTA